MKTDIANGFKNSQSVFLVCSSLTTSPTMFDSNTALPQSTQYGVYYLSGKQDSKLATVVVMRSGMEMMSTNSVRVVQLLAIHPTARSRARSWLNLELRHHEAKVADDNNSQGLFGCQPQHRSWGGRSGIRDSDPPNHGSDSPRQLSHTLLYYFKFY